MKLEWKNTDTDVIDHVKIHVHKSSYMIIYKVEDI